mmetsp:Transcript_9162/g.20418  ORF Transcript_9162/g.20418 Transcript_9162/m.20418 type:complete len:236 (+) Transcript_9162:80-787(+)|eukprot:CAMPEP_0178401546 /NCGR_PEP_ID=MMETSP0689_2-20121128/16359_1 /TAXON_ID=160604 /ORGANISM="Amphidinium massartii, Strain CS-259" /LENGTH=235 /DNA_ID=CAMNT_0020022373 /DNA_START=84 /DNA_END=791 /DNA_ORIENTATION=-
MEPETLPAEDSYTPAPPTPDDEDDVPFVNEQVTVLYRRWRNEKYAPEVLPFDAKLIEDIRDLVEFVSEGLQEELDSGAAHDNDVDHRLRSVDLSRIRYVLREYLRIRLRKLEEWPQHYLQGENVRWLSKAESSHVRDLWQIRSGFFHHRLLSAMPNTKQGLEDNVDLLEMVRRPNLDHYVYIRFLEDVPETFLVDAADQADLFRELKKNETYLVNYSTVRKFFFQADLDGIVELV